MTATSGSGTSRRRRPAPANGTDEASPQADRLDAIMSVGTQLRDRRLAAGLTLRQFARDLGVSPSFVSQIENGKSRPSVATLYAICNALDLSIDELFSRADVADEALPTQERPGGPRAHRRAHRTDTNADVHADTHSFRGALAELDAPPEHHQRSPVVEPARRRRLVLDSGVTWEQLSAAHESSVDFLLVRYEIGGSSVPDEELTRHSGVEYGYVISGTLDVSLGFDTYRIGPGDAISFDSTTPHRLTNNCDVPVEAIWFVHGRSHSAG